MTRYRRVRAFGALAACLAGLLSACSHSTSASSSSVVASVPLISSAVDDRNPLRVELIRPAIAALETQLGGPQRYLEVNATPTLVNLFVAVSNATQAVAYVYTNGKLSEPAPPEKVKAEAPTFGAADIAFDEATVLKPVLIALPKTTYRVFSVVGIVGGGVSYLVSLQSSQGGDLQVPVQADGSIIGAVQK